MTNLIEKETYMLEERCFPSLAKLALAGTILLSKTKDVWACLRVASRHLVGREFPCVRFVEVRSKTLSLDLMMLRLLLGITEN